MGYKLFLDDFRQPCDCATYMHQRIGAKNHIYLQHWHIAKNYDHFIRIITKLGLPEFVSFDHDLSDEHYSPDMYSGADVYNKHYATFKEKTGYECAKWLVEYCIEKKVKFPGYAVHSMNPIGTENIKQLIERFIRQ